ncbi:MAG: hypothetical protein JW712_09275 [Dehalococcoidales bacterium]|nr:hypothetical protein [Dehalococcoidales bacterium]
MKRQLWYKATTFDRKRNLLAGEERPARSFLGLWNKIIWCQVVQPYHLSCPTTDIDGAYWPAGKGDTGHNFRMNGEADNARLGIVIGTSDTPVSISDYRLGQQINQGHEAGQMDYLVTTIHAPVVSDPNCDLLISRQMANNSGSMITVRESGIYMLVERGISPYTEHNCCGIRDVFSTPLDVPDGGGITVEYTLRVTE